MDYSEFVSQKLAAVSPVGLPGPFNLHNSLFPHQIDLVTWALKRGRAAIFADTGLGKTRMELSWAREIGGNVLMLAPLAVARQTAREGESLGIPVTVCREMEDVRLGISITNYDRAHKFDPREFDAVVLDESSIIKHSDSKTFGRLTDQFRRTPYKLCATATPAPNDWTELGTHAEFLGICTKAEMLAEFFTHDGGDTSVWRLKGHARHQFWRWVVSWGAMIRRPSDLGYDDAGYALPALNIRDHTVDVDLPADGALFAMDAQTLSERRQARRRSLDDRVQKCAEIIFGEWQENGMEAGIRSKSSGEVKERSGVSSKEELSGGERSRSKKIVHEGLRESEPEEIPQITGSAGSVQREASEKVRGKRDVSRGAQVDSSGVGRNKSGEETRSANQEVWPDAGSTGADAGSARQRMRHMRTHGETAQALSDDRSLPSDGEGAGDSLLSMQHGHRTLSGQSRTYAEGDRVLEKWVIWCDLNSEQDALEIAFGDLAFSIRGSDSADEKENLLLRWLEGERPAIISKTSILGWGINMQCAARMAFVGVTDSYEAVYQAIRRCWRFGQKSEVDVHVIASSAEGAVIANLKRKGRDADAMAESLTAETRHAIEQEIHGAHRETNEYAANEPVRVPSFLEAA